MKRFFQKKTYLINVNVDGGMLMSLPTGLRIPILDYNANIRDQIRRAYMLKGPCQPQDHDAP